MTPTREQFKVFTADLHFGHSNILKHSPKRPFSDTDLDADDLKLTKHHCFLRRSSSGFYSPGSMYSVDDISHPIAQSELSDETRVYIEHYDWPVRTECFLLSELETFADKCQEVGIKKAETATIATSANLILFFLMMPTSLTTI